MQWEECWRAGTGLYGLHIFSKYRILVVELLLERSSQA